MNVNTRIATASDVPPVPNPLLKSEILGALIVDLGPTEASHKCRPYKPRKLESIVRVPLNSSIAHILLALKIPPNVRHMGLQMRVLKFPVLFNFEKRLPGSDIYG